MKLRNIFTIAFLLCATIMCASTINLSGTWKFKQSSDTEWLPATVPGQVHTDLLANELIKDPFVGVNEKRLQWIGEKDWEYARTFEVTADELNNEHVELIMQGVDTYADVYVNDIKVAQCDNMFRTWTVDVKPYLRVGENHIRFYFHSVFKVDMPKYLQAPFKLQVWPNNDQNSDIWLSVYARKAGYNYGWDWGPRLITAGVWQDIAINAWSEAKIDGLHIYTKQIARKKATMGVNYTIHSDRDVVATIQLSAADVLHKQSVALKEGVNDLTFDFDVKNPKLWWSNGLGEAQLYDFDFSCTTPDVQLQETVRTGIRTIEVVREKDSLGTSLFVRLNGKDVFMKGANVIPTDNFPNRTQDDFYAHMIRSAADANMNMLRVWGGGIFEKKVFYDLCDQHGILVWQDMMFACGMFPANPEYLNSVAHEVRDNVKRLRNHACIALWNGNNENEVSYFGWGWRNNMSKEDDRIYQANLHKLFYEVIPQAIQTVDPTRYYHPTSPNTGYNGVKANHGDVHMWSVWKGAPIEEYEKPRNIGRFMSEYGFQSYPEFSTIRKFAGKKDLDINNAVMLCHQRAMKDDTRDPFFGNKMMAQYMERYFVAPTDFQQFIYMSQVMQAEAVKVGVEAHRRAKPYCMGTLYWQLNDCWPAASWASIDYYGKWKALHYFARTAFAEIMVSPYKNAEKMGIKLISDRQTAFEATCRVQVKDFSGKELYTNTSTVKVPANTCLDLQDIDINAYGSAESTYAAVEILENGKIVAANTYYPVYANKQQYAAHDIQLDFEQAADGVYVNINTDTLVRYFYMWLYNDDTTFFADNYLTLEPGVTKRVFVRTTRTAADLKAKLKYLTYNQIVNQ